jgi:catechol 2,3-dioxygenase-like lactoylglutathione lyase family enzyme
MAHERTHPCLPCRDIDESIVFYEALGFTRTYRQLRPNPYAVVALEDMQFHLFGIDGFNPADSYACVIVEVSDTDSLYRAFSAGLRQAFGKLPVAGIPRMTRPRSRWGTVRGFSVVDPGGNWLRISRLGDSEQPAAAERPHGLAQILDVAARLGDSHGDEALALRTLERGLARFGDARSAELARAYLYRAELAYRTHDHELAQSSLTSAQALDLSHEDKASLDDEFAFVASLVHPE